MREYAALAPTARDALRKGRLWRGALALFGGILPTLGLVPFVRLAFGGVLGASVAPYFLLGPSVLLAMAAVALSDRERRIVGPARARLGKHKSHREGDPRVVASWIESFDRVRNSKDPGSPRQSRLPPSEAMASAVAGESRISM